MKLPRYLPDFVVIGLAFGFVMLGAWHVHADALAAQPTDKCQFTSTMQETWGQYSKTLDAALKTGKLKSGDFMSICGMQKNGRHGREIPVYGLSGSTGISPTISLHYRLPQ